MIVIAEKVKFKGWVCDVVLSTYAVDQSNALLLLDSDTSERIATATVNLSGYGVNLKGDLIPIKNYSENEGMLQTLLDAGVIGDPIRTVHTGHTEIPIVKLLKKEEVA